MAPDKKRKRLQDGGESIPAKKPHMKKSGDLSKSPKSVPKSSSSVPVAAAPSTTVAPSTLRAVRNEEESFPRGGASALTPLEFKQISNEAARDVLFEAGGGAAGAGDGDATLKKGKKPKRRHEEKKGKNTAKEEEEKKDQGPIPEGLSFKASFCLWCVVWWSEVLISYILIVEFDTGDAYAWMHFQNKCYGSCNLTAKQPYWFCATHFHLQKIHQADRIVG